MHARHEAAGSDTGCSPRLGFGKVNLLTKTDGLVGDDSLDRLGATDRLYGDRSLHLGAMGAALALLLRRRLRYLRGLSLERYPASEICDGTSPEEPDHLTPLLSAFGAGHHINPRGLDVGQSKRGQNPFWGRVIWWGPPREAQLLPPIGGCLRPTLPVADGGGRR